jgi:excisionase family DNA binding protein
MTTNSIIDTATTAAGMPRALFTADEVAEALVISETLVRQLTLEGEIPCRRIGRLVRYTTADIEMFIASREEHPYRR